VLYSLTAFSLLSADIKATPLCCVQCEPCFTQHRGGLCLWYSYCHTVSGNGIFISNSNKIIVCWLDIFIHRTICFKSCQDKC